MTNSIRNSKHIGVHAIEHATTRDKNGHRFLPAIRRGKAYKRKSQMRLIVAAIGVLCATTQLAHANSVQIYGALDTGVEYLTNVGPEEEHLTRASRLTGGYMPSRWGLRGSEDLGSGLSAIFNLEGGFAVTDGTLGQGGRLFGRAAFVGVSAPWGTVTLGRHQEMLWTALLQGDVIGPAAFSMVDFDPFLASARQDNSIAYKGKFQNITLGATYSLGRDTLAPGNCAGELPGGGSSCKAWSAMAQYDTPTWGTAIGYDEQRGGGTSRLTVIPSQNPVAFSNPEDKDRRALLDGFVKFGNLKVAGGLIHRQISTTARSENTNLYFLGGSYPLSSTITVDGQYVALCSNQQDTDANLLVARAGYKFSARTTAYVMVGHMSNGKAASYSVSSTSSVPAAPALGQDQTGVLIGLNHRF